MAPQQATKIIFADFDNTLIQYHALGRGILRDVLAEQGIPFDETAWSKLPHLNMQDKLKMFLPHHYDTVWPEADKRFTARVVTESYLFPETRDFLKQVRDKKILFVIVSTKFARHIHNILAHHKLTEYVDEVIGRETVDPPKPHPKSILDLLTKYNLPKEEALLLGDSALDGEMAHNAHIRFVHIKRSETHEIMPPAWKTINSLTELIPLL